jgi:heme exporter protein D
MTQFFAMGGYAVFVWPSYALSVFALVGLSVWALREHAATRATLKRMETKNGPSE